MNWFVHDPLIIKLKFMSLFYANGHSDSFREWSLLSTQRYSVRCQAVLKKLDIFESSRSTFMDSSNNHGLLKRIFDQGKLLCPIFKVSFFFIKLSERHIRVK